MREARPRRRGPIDWAEVRARLKQAEAASQEALHPTPERGRAIMDARARVLAQPLAPPPLASRLDVVLFALGRERYAIETRLVREVIRLADITPVPGTPDFLVGVTNLRGTVLAVMDLRHFVNVAATGLTDLSRVIVLGSERVEFGILADQVHGQAALAPDHILVPDRVPGVEFAYLRGVTEDALIVLEGEALLRDPRLTLGDDVQTAAFDGGA